MVGNGPPRGSPGSGYTGGATLRPGGHYSRLQGTRSPSCPPSQCSLILCVFACFCCGLDDGVMGFHHDPACTTFSMSGVGCVHGSADPRRVGTAIYMCEHRLLGSILSTIKCPIGQFIGPWASVMQAHYCSVAEASLLTAARHQSISFLRAVRVVRTSCHPVNWCTELETIQLSADNCHDGEG